jgi:hypothetical protein
MVFGGNIFEPPVGPITSLFSEVGPVAPSPLQSVGSVLPVADSSLASETSVPRPPTLIKDKTLDMGIKDIANKELWMDAKKIMNFMLKALPFLASSHI